MTAVKASASGSQAKQRPKFLNVVAIRLPLAGIVSIFHRISGTLLFLLLPWLIGLFGLSLESEAGFHKVREILTFPLARLVLFGLVWAYLHHFCAGIRFLLLDLHIGLDKIGARRSAVAVLAVSLSLTVLVMGAIWRAF